MSKPCSVQQIRNPATGRCVKIDGKIGKSLLGCPNLKIRNPETGRCVLMTSKIGKSILARDKEIIIEVDPTIQLAQPAPQPSQQTPQPAQKLPSKVKIFMEINDPIENMVKSGGITFVKVMEIVDEAIKKLYGMQLTEKQLRSLKNKIGDNLKEKEDQERAKGKTLNLAGRPDVVVLVTKNTIYDYMTKKLSK